MNQKENNIVNRILGIEQLFENQEKIEALKAIIVKKTGCTVPGYRYNYLHYRPAKHLKFEYCYDARDEKKHVLESTSTFPVPIPATYSAERQSIPISQHHTIL